MDPCHYSVMCLCLLDIFKLSNIYIVCIGFKIQYLVGTLKRELHGTSAIGSYDILYLTNILRLFGATLARKPAECDEDLHQTPALHSAAADHLFIQRTYIEEKVPSFVI